MRRRAGLRFLPRRRHTEPRPERSPSELRHLDGIEKQVSALAASVASLGADLEARAARSAQAYADAAHRFGLLERGLADSLVRLAEAEAHSAASVADVRAALAHTLGEQQRSHAAELERHAARLADQLAEARTTWEHALTAAEARRTQDLQTLGAEHRTRLDELTHQHGELARRVQDADRDLEARIDHTSHELRDRMNASVDELSRQVREQADHHQRALEQHHRDVDRRTTAAEDAVATVGDRLLAATTRIDAAEASHAELQREYTAICDALREANASAERLGARLADEEQRTEELTARTARLAAVAATVDELRERIAATEVLLAQRDDTDLEEYLDRVEAFERLAAELNPDAFASRAELDGLRAQLALEHVLAPRDVVTGG